MKNSLLIIAFALFSVFSFSATVTITNTGFEFSPDEVTINLGDTVIFQLQNSHNAVEVSQATWNANGNTPLPGFSLPFGGGTVTGLSVGEHFYVCTPHASGGMKGRITVNGPSGIRPDESLESHFRLFPVPSTGVLMLESDPPANTPGQNMNSTLEVFNFLGEKVFEQENIDLRDTRTLDISALPSGNYILRIRNESNSYTGKFIKID